MRQNDRLGDIDPPGQGLDLHSIGDVASHGFGIPAEARSKLIGARQIRIGDHEPPARRKRAGNCGGKTLRRTDYNIGHYRLSNC
jgi:hypothetical protein